MAAAAAAAVALTASACGGSASPAASTSPAKSRATTAAPQTASPATAQPSTTASSGPAGAAPGSKLLAGKIVGIDPGHNGLNHTDPAYIDRQIWNGRESEDCDTTGTETDSGYTEAQFNFNVATYLRKDLRREGARVVMTRKNNDGVGPCVDRRAQIINHSHADVAIDIHADGGPPAGRGFTVLEPVADGPNDASIAASLQFGSDVRAAFIADTPMQTSTYDGTNGLVFRDDLAGLNLTTVPKVLIESGNMRNSSDATLLTSASVQMRIAHALEIAIIRFLTGR
jgi:N-acetylmuramoyl-L-alanine amidase